MFSLLGATMAQPMTMYSKSFNGEEYGVMPGRTAMSIAARCRGISARPIKPARLIRSVTPRAIACASNPAIDAIKRAIPGAMYELLELAYNLTAFLRLRRAVAEFQPDVIYERFSLFLLAGMWVHRLSGVRWLLEINAPLCEERARNDGLKLHALGRWAQGLIWRSADVALPVTGVLAKTVMSYGVPEARIRVIHNGIDKASFAGTLPRPTAKAALGLPGGVVIASAKEK